MTEAEINKRLDELQETVTRAYEQAEALRGDFVSADCVVLSDIYEDSGVRATLGDLFACMGRIAHGRKTYLPEHFDRLTTGAEQ